MLEGLHIPVNLSIYQTVHTFVFWNLYTPDNPIGAVEYADSISVRGQDPLRPIVLDITQNRLIWRL